MKKVGNFLISKLWVTAGLLIFVVWTANDMLLNRISLPKSLFRSSGLFAVLGILAIFWVIVSRINHYGVAFWKFLLPSILVFLAGIIVYLIYNLLKLQI